RAAPGVRKTSDNSLRYTQESVQLEVVATSARAVPNRGVETYLRNQYRLLDREKKGFITRAQTTSGPGQILRGILDLADRDGDGKLPERELNAWRSLAAQAPNGRVSLSFAETGQGLFQLLDANGDGQLSIRELRTAWTRLAAYDADGDGCISRKEI